MIEPSGTGARLNRLLVDGLDEAAMTAAIAPDPHRLRAEPSLFLQEVATR